MLKNHMLRKVFPVMIALCVFSTVLLAGSPHLVTGNLQYSDGPGIPSSISFSAYITSRPGEILTQSSSGCSYNSSSGQWTVECGSFSTQWTEGDVLHVEFFDGTFGSTASDNVTLSSVTDYGGTTNIPCPDITVSSTNINFDAVDVGDSKDLILTIGNSGHSALQVSNMELLTGNIDQFTIVSGDAPFMVPSGGSHGITLRFTPLFDCSKQTDLHIYSNDIDENDLVVRLSGKGCAADLGTFDNGNFDTILLGATIDKSIQISNWGERECIVSSTMIIGPNAGDFSIVSGGGAFTMPHHTDRDVIIRFSPLSTGIKKATLSMDTNDPRNDPFEIPLSGTAVWPKISVDRDSRDFDHVFVDSTKIRQFMVQNEGFSDLVITHMEIINRDDYKDFKLLISSSFTLYTGQSLTVWIAFTPTSQGEKSATLKIECNDPDNPMKEILLTGIGVKLPVESGEPDLQLSSDSLDFGETEVDFINNQELVLSNTGNAILEISSISVMGMNKSSFCAVLKSSESALTKASTDTSDLLTIAPGDTEVIVVTFSPETEGEKKATLKIISNDPDENPAEVVLLGTGIEHSEEVELTLRYCYPPPNAKCIPVNTDIQFMINGLTDLTSHPLNVNVNGDPLVLGSLDQTGGETTYKVSEKGCNVMYHSANHPFEENSTVTVHIQCASQIDTTYTFSTGTGANCEKTRIAVTSNGGKVTCDSTHIVIDVPSGTVEDTVEISIGIISDVPALPDSVDGIGLAYHFGPEGFKFLSAVMVGVPYTAEDLLSATVSDPMELKVYYFVTSTGEWVLMDVVDADDNYIYILVRQFCCLTLGINQHSTVTTTEEISQKQPDHFSLSQNYPNPFNPTTHIHYCLGEAANVQIQIYDVLGNYICTLVNKYQTAGNYHVNWDAVNRQGDPMSSGIYYYKIETPQFHQIRKMMLIR